MDMKLELVPVPVEDVDRSRDFFVHALGFVQDVRDLEASTEETLLLKLACDACRHDEQGRQGGVPCPSGERRGIFPERFWCPFCSSVLGDDRSGVFSTHGSGAPQAPEGAYSSSPSRWDERGGI